VWIRGNVTYITGTPAGKQTPMHTVEGIWLPSNIKSNRALNYITNGMRIYKASNFGTKSNNRSAYNAMDAHYAKTTGS